MAVIERSKLCGFGTFGSVYEATYSGSKYAYKRFNEPLYFLQSVVRELACINQINHENVISMVAFLRIDNVYGMLLPLMDINLAEYLDGNPSRHIAAKIMGQILRGVGCLHEWGWIHRDIKPYNIMISKLDHSVKVIDLGASTNVITCYDISHDVQTVCYRPPEVLIMKRHTIESDIWSIGIIYAELLTGMLHVTSTELILVQKIINTIGLGESIMPKSFESQFIQFGSPYDKLSSFEVYEKVRAVASTSEMEILKKMMTVDPCKRALTAELIGLFDGVNVVDTAVDSYTERAFKKFLTIEKSISVPVVPSVGQVTIAIVMVIDASQTLKHMTITTFTAVELMLGLVDLGSSDVYLLGLACLHLAECFTENKPADQEYYLEKLGVRDYTIRQLQNLERTILEASGSTMFSVPNVYNFLNMVMHMIKKTNKTVGDIWPFAKNMLMLMYIMVEPVVGWLPSELAITLFHYAKKVKSISDTDLNLTCTCVDMDIKIGKLESVVSTAAKFPESSVVGLAYRRIFASPASGS